MALLLSTIERLSTSKTFKAMKKFLNLPKDSDFFNRYASLVPTLYKAGYLGQLISALTEFGVIYASVKSTLTFFSPGVANFGAFIGAVLGVLIIELGLRKLIPYSVQAVLHKRYQGLDRVMTIIIMTACAVLLCAGTFMSYHGSHEVVEALKPEPKLQGTGQAEKQYTEADQLALGKYRADSAEISGRYAGLIAAQTLKHDAQIELVKGQLKGIEARERGGQSFSSAKSEARSRLAKQEAAKALAMADLSVLQNQEMKAAADRRNQTQASAAAALDQVKQKTNQVNEKTLASTERQTNRYKGGLSIFTIICHMLLLVSIVVSEVHKKGSGIEEKVLPTQYDFSDGIWGELHHALSNRWNQMIRTRIRAFEEATPPPPLPVSPNELYSLENLQQPVYELNFEEVAAAYKQIEIPSRVNPAAGKSSAPAPASSMPGPAGGTPGNKAPRPGKK
jgi:hypothetical protein